MTDYQREYGELCLSQNPTAKRIRPSAFVDVRIHVLDSQPVSAEAYDSPLDPGIEGAVLALAAGGIETFESCQGGPGHAFPEPTVRFHGDSVEGYKALAVALRAGLRVLDLRRVWPVIDGEPTGPWWELTFRTTASNDVRAST